MIAREFLQHRQIRNFKRVLLPNGESIISYEVLK